MRTEYQYVAARRQQAEQFDLMRIVFIRFGGLPLQPDQRAIAASQRAGFALRRKLLGGRYQVAWSPGRPLQPVRRHTHSPGEKFDAVDTHVRRLPALDSCRRTVREVEPGR